MYSMVLMMALSGSADVPALGHHHSCTGCSGCSGYVVAECYGGGCSGGHREKHQRKHGCSGCSGCTGVVYASCSGGESCGGGCSGHHKREKKHKHGCCGCSGSSCYGSSSYGSSYGACTGSVIYSSPVVGCVGSAPVYVEPAHEGKKEEKKEEKKPESIKEPKGDKEANLLAPATIVVSLPAEAKLAIDGYVTTSTSSVRTLTSPVLEDGKDYVYTLTAEVVRGGKSVTTSKEITVRAGEAINVALEIPQAIVALK